MSSLKPASTILVLRKRNISSIQKRFNYEILMLKRRTQARFMSGAYVFPGGVVEESDLDIKWKSLTPLSPHPFHEIVLENEPKQKIDEFHFRIGSLRELFEEGNLLLGAEHISPDVLQNWRTLVQNDSKKFMEMCNSLKIKLPIHSLYPWAHWITPAVEKYRYDTLFYVTTLDNASSQSAVHDDKETTASNWFSPDEALEQFEKGTIWLAPPTWHNLMKLSNFPQIDQVISYCRNKTFGKDILPLLPTFIYEKPPELTIPSDKTFVAILNLLDGEKIAIIGDSTDIGNHSWKYFFLPRSSKL